MSDISPYVTQEDGSLVLNKDFYKDKHLIVCTPCFGGNVTDLYLTSCLELQQYAFSFGMQISFYTLRNESLITRGRNSATAYFLSQPTATHMMFIDADIQFSAADVLRMMAHDVDIVAGNYPLKSIDWNRVREAAKAEIEDIESYSSYCVVHKDPDDSTDYGVLISAAEVGTGFMLIKRKVFDVMIGSYPELKYNHDGYGTSDADDFYYNFWDTILLNKRYLSEDYAFCYLWKQLGGKIFLDKSVELKHTGTYTFKGKYIQLC